MSGAFTREQEDDRTAEATLDLPTSDNPNYVTKTGLKELEQRRETLTTERERLRAHGEDLENATHFQQVERQVRYLDARIRDAIVIDPASQPHDKVAFGAKVTVADETGDQEHYRIVGEDEADASQNKVSWVSPLARALEGCVVGDTVTWRRPSGDRELEIVGISYPD